MSNPGMMMGYILGGAMVVVGILVLAGVLSPRAGWDPTLGTVFGVVVLLFGLYRIVITDGKRRRLEREERSSARSD